MRYLLIGLLLVLSNGVYAQTNQSELTLEVIDSKIQALESALMQAQSDRFKEKHKAEYNDPEASAQYQKARELEVELINARKEYLDRLRVLDQDYRTLESTLSKHFKTMDELKVLHRAIARELALASDPITRNDSMVVTLTEEAAQLDTQLSQLGETIKETEESLEERKQEVTASDKKATKLAGKVEDLEARHTELYRDVRTKIDGLQNIQSLDDKRQELVQEMQALRAQRLKLLEAQP